MSLWSTGFISQIKIKGIIRSVSVSLWVAGVGVCIVILKPQQPEASWSSWKTQDVISVMTKWWPSPAWSCVYRADKQWNCATMTHLQAACIKKFQRKHFSNPWTNLSNVQNVTWKRGVWGQRGLKISSGMQNVTVHILNVWLNVRTEAWLLCWVAVGLQSVRRQIRLRCFGHRVGQKPTNHTELWNLGHSSPQACQPSFLSQTLFLLAGFLHSAFRNKARWISEVAAEISGMFGMQAAPRTAAQTWIKFHLHLSLIKEVSF